MFQLPVTNSQQLAQVGEERDRQIEDYLNSLGGGLLVGWSIGAPAMPLGEIDGVPHPQDQEQYFELPDVPTGATGLHFAASYTYQVMETDDSTAVELQLAIYKGSGTGVPIINGKQTLDTYAIEGTPFNTICATGFYSLEEGAGDLSSTFHWVMEFTDSTIWAVQGDFEINIIPVVLEHVINLPPPVL